MEAVSPGTDLYGFQANKLQSDVVIGRESITGTLKYVTGYTGFDSAHPDEQKGNFLALSLKAAEGVEIKTKLINGNHSNYIKVTDGFCVYHIGNKATQKVEVVYTKDGLSITKTYDLSGLDCQQQGSV